MEWLMTSLMAAVGSLCSNMRVKVLETYNEPMFLYSIILGLPGTKKTFAIKFLKKEILVLIEKHPDAVHLNSSKYRYIKHIVLHFNFYNNYVRCNS
jgi:hypothetical protein